MSYGDRPVTNGGYPESTIYAGEVGGAHPATFGQQVVERSGLPADVERRIVDIEAHPAPTLLDRMELDRLIGTLTAGDLMRAQRAVGDDATRMMGVLFTEAAKRAGLVVPDASGAIAEDAGLDLIRITDVQYLTDRIGGQVNPTMASTEPSPNFASTGG